MKRHRLFYDIETSFCKGHFWRPGYNQRIGPEQITDYAKIISAHWKWEGEEEEVHHAHWGLEKQCDKSLIKKLLKQFEKADEIVTHNGKKFDTPWVRTRALYHGIPMRPDYNEIDTYKLAKSYLNLPSFSLKEICKYYNLEAKKDAGGLDTWKDVVFKKCPKAFEHLLYYGDGDITSLEAVFNKLRPYVKPNTHYHSEHISILGLKAVPGKFFCPECGRIGRHRKQYRTMAGTIRHYMSCTDDKCGTSFKLSHKSFVDFNTYKIANNIT